MGGEGRVGAFLKSLVRDDASDQNIFFTLTDLKEMGEHQKEI